MADTRIREPLMDDIPDALQPQRPSRAAPEPDRSKASDAFAEPEEGAWMVGRKRLAQSLILEEKGPGGGSRLLAIVIIVFVGAFLVWSSYTRITEVVVSSGEVSPIGSIKEVQHLEGGIVAGINIAEGDLVSKNQILIELESSVTRPELDQMHTRLAGLELEAQQLSAVMTGDEVAETGINARYKEMAFTQLQVFKAKRDAEEAQLDVIKRQIAQKREEQRFLRSQEAAIKRQIGFVQEEVNMRKELLDKGLMPKIVMLENQRELARTQSQLAEIRGQQRRLSEGVAELVSRQGETTARIAMEAAEGLGKIQNEIHELREAIAQVEGRVQRLTIRSPVRGIVHSLKTRTLGGVVSPGATVAEVIPLDAELIVEARVLPKDIGFIHPGLEARVKVQTYDFTRYGDIVGTIERISATTFTDDKQGGDAFYKAHIRLEKNFVGNDPKRNLVVPGMTVTADVRTGEKTLAEYLLKPIYKAMSEAFRER